MRHISGEEEAVMVGQEPLSRGKSNPRLLKMTGLSVNCKAKRKEKKPLSPDNLLMTQIILSHYTKYFSKSQIDRRED